MTLPNEPRALPVAAGSVASASTSMAGRSPRSRSREKFSGMLMTNCTSPRASRSCASSSVCDLLHEIEVSAVLHRVEQRSPVRAAIGEDHGGRQMPRVGVDGETEKHELDQRDAEHHREGQPVAPHLGELLHDDPAQASEGKFRMPLHGAKLSFEPSIRLMKTSSSPEGISRHS